MGRGTDIPHRVYTAEFKTEAVKLADEVGMTEAARSRLSVCGGKGQPVSEAQAEITSGAA
jgi:hypothetical protein